MQSAYVLAAIQLLLILMLAADRWVHKVTGPAPLEARLVALERSFKEGNQRCSEAMSTIQSRLIDAQVVAARQDERLDAIDKTVVNCQQQILQIMTRPHR